MTEQTPPSKADRPECDINKTQTLIDLFQIPPEQRDEAWSNSFYENVQTASYACGTPQVFRGPDGFPYFILKTPEPNQPFESFCISNMKDDFLLEKGFGVVLNPTDLGADWVFSYGDILNLHLNREFYSHTDDPVVENVETVKKETEILIAQPSETYLPKQSRVIIEKFLQSIGLQQPKLVMICRTVNEKMVQELAFNIFVEDFADSEQLNNYLHRISWFLPRHYIILAVPKNSDLVNHFADL